MPMLDLISIKTPFFRVLSARVATQRKRPSHLQVQGRHDSRELLLVWLPVLAVGGTVNVYWPGHRMCAIRAPSGPKAFV